MRSPRLALAVAASRAARRASRATGRGGTSLPGKVLLRLAPGAIAGLTRELARGSAAISATNGKTTTAAMVTSILERDGTRVLSNAAGANMAGGVATTLAENRPRRDLGLFEVDELWLPQVAAQLAPTAILLANLFRDQLDRAGELETIASRWADLARETTARLVLNADDPTVADLGRDAEDALFFGVEDRALAMPAMQHASDARHCRRCGSAYRYDAILLAHLGHYSCPTGDAKRPTPQVAVHDVVLDGVRASRFRLVLPDGEGEVRLPLPGLYNVYNAAGAAALAHALGATRDEVVAGLEAVEPAFGRAEVVRLDGRDVPILLVKNPAGANEVLRTLTLEPGEHDVLCVLNDRIADGRDVSWVWDADWEVLAQAGVRRAVCAGTRAAEMALRLRYAGVPEDRLVVQPALSRALDDATAGAGGARLFLLPTYTAMLELREELVRRGVARSSFG